MQENNEANFAKCPNCQKQIAQQKLDLHYSYCSRKFIKCLQCLQFYDKMYAQQHVQDNHKNKICQHCSGTFSLTQYINHKKQCGPKFIICVHCDQKIPEIMFDQHRKICQARTIECQICGNPVSIKQMRRHEEMCMDRLSNPDKYPQYGAQTHKKYKTSENVIVSRPKSVAVDLYNRPTNNRGRPKQKQTITIPSTTKFKLPQSQPTKKQKNVQQKQKKQEKQIKAKRPIQQNKIENVINLSDDQSNKQKPNNTNNNNNNDDNKNTKKQKQTQ